MQSQFKVVADGAALGFGNSPQPLPLILAPEFIWLQYFLDQAVGPGEYFLSQVVGASTRFLDTDKFLAFLAPKSVRPNVISGGQLSKCGDLLEIEIY